MIAVINHKKNVSFEPFYAYIIEDNKDNGFITRPGTRYPIIWKRGLENFFGSIDPTENNLVNFGHTSLEGGYMRKFITTGITDNSKDAFVYLYYTSTQDLYCIVLKVNEARFGGIVVEPAMDHPMVEKFTRQQYLMNKWRQLTPLIGKWALFFNQLYTEVTYRPGNLGALSAAKDFQKYI